MLAMAVGAVLALGLSYRRAPTPLARAQLKWVLWALSIPVALNVVERALPLVAGHRVAVPFSVSALAEGFVPLGIGFAILRYRLLDVDVLIGRTLVYGALTICVVGLYALVVGVLVRAVPAPSGDLARRAGRDRPRRGAFQPLRERLQRGVNRLLYGQRDEPYAVLSRLGQRLAAALAPEAGAADRRRDGRATRSRCRTSRSPLERRRPDERRRRGGRASRRATVAAPADLSGRATVGELRRRAAARPGESFGVDRPAAARGPGAPGRRRRPRRRLTAGSAALARAAGQRARGGAAPAAARPARGLGPRSRR